MRTNVVVNASMHNAYAYFVVFPGLRFFGAYIKTLNRFRVKQDSSETHCLFNDGVQQEFELVAY